MTGRIWRDRATRVAKPVRGAGVDDDLTLVVALAAVNMLVLLGLLQPSVLQQITFRYCADKD